MTVKLMPYADTRDSGLNWLGDIPVHWELVPLKVIAKVDNSGCYGAEPEESKHVYPVATTAQIDANGTFRVEAMPKRSFSSTEVSRYLCRDGDILVVKSSGSATNIISGKAGLVNSSTPKFIFSNFLLRISPEQNRACPSFVYGLLTSHLTRERIKQMVSTTTYPNLQVGEYCSAKLPLPPLQEQRTIASFIDHETARINRLIAKQQRLIELLKEKRQAVISHAITKGLNPDAPMKDSGVEWLGQVPAVWKVGRLGYYCQVSNGTTPSKSNLEYWTDGDVPWLSSGAVNQYEITDASDFITGRALAECSLKLLPPGTVVIGMIGQGKTRGTAAITRIKATINQNLAAAVPNQKIDSEFLLFVVQSAYTALRETGRGGNQAALNCELIADLRITVPSLVEQQEIVSYLDRETARFEMLTDRAVTAVELLQERRTALISAAVTGKIDVRNWTPAGQPTKPEQLMAAEPAAEYQVS